MQMVSIEWTLEADEDFDSIIGYRNNVSTQYAYSKYEKVQDALYNLKKISKNRKKNT